MALPFSAQTPSAFSGYLVGHSSKQDIFTPTLERRALSHFSGF
jgi:hypothetical protein